MFSHYFARRCSQASPTLGAEGSSHFALSLPRPSLPVSPPLPPFFLFPPCPPFLFFFWFFFFFLPSRLLPRALPRGWRESPCRRREGSVSFFSSSWGVLCVCVWVCVAAARACGARVGERGRSSARLKEPWMARRGDMDSGKSGGRDHSETGRDAPGPG